MPCNLDPFPTLFLIKYIIKIKWTTSIRNSWNLLLLWALRNPLPSRQKLLGIGEFFGKACVDYIVEAVSGEGPLLGALDLSLAIFHAPLLHKTAAEISALVDILRLPSDCLNALWRHLGDRYCEMAGDAKSCKFCAASPLHQLDCANISCLLPINQPRDPGKTGGSPGAGRSEL